MKFRSGFFVLAIALMMVSAWSVGTPETTPVDKPLTYVNSLFWSNLYDVAVAGNYAYCSFRNGLMILDVSQKEKPEEVSRLYLGGGSGIDLKPGLAFIAARDKGLLIVDISNPRAPVLKGSFDTPGEALEVVVLGDTAYVADGPEGFRVVDVRNTSAPVSLGHLDTPGSASGIAVTGKTVFVADGEEGLRIIDCSNPAAPKELGSCDTPGVAEGVTVSASADYAYVADEDTGLQEPFGSCGSGFL
jgi:hypothetical protein